jgi:hypothetical protein
MQSVLSNLRAYTRTLSRLYPGAVDLCTLLFGQESRLGYISLISRLVNGETTIEEGRENLGSITILITRIFPTLTVIHKLLWIRGNLM